MRCVFTHAFIGEENRRKRNREAILITEKKKVIRIKYFFLLFHDLCVRETDRAREGLLDAVLLDDLLRKPIGELLLQIISYNLLF